VPSTSVPDGGVVVAVVVAVVVPVPRSMVRGVEVAAVLVAVCPRSVGVEVAVGDVEVAAGGVGGASTTTLNVVGVALLPAASDAVQVTVLVPTKNSELEGGVHDARPGGSTLSEVVGRS
jgi:hypothetical protein